MKIILLVLLILSSAHAQIMNNLEIENNLTLNAQTASRALILDAQKRLVSSTVSDTELAYLVGVTSSIQTQIGLKANDNAVVKLTGDQSISGKKTFTQYEAVSTTLASKPCPVMTEAQRDLLSPVTGDCVYNSTENKQNIYNGSQWMKYGRTVAAIYNQNSGQSSSGDTVMLYNVSILDTHSAYNSGTGVFTAPESGVYQVNASWTSAAKTWAANERISMKLEINGTETHAAFFRIYTTSSQVQSAQISRAVSLNASDTLEILKQADGNPASFNDARYNNLSIIKVGDL